MGECNGCGDPSVPTVNEDALECCELTPTNCVVTSDYQEYFKIGKGKTLTYAINKIASVVKAIAVRVTNLEALHNYSTFTAIITQAGVIAPTATIVDNKIGGTPAWAYVSPGVYTLTLTGAFTADKTIIELKDWDIPWGAKVKAFRVDVDTIQIESGNASGDYIDDDVITSMPIEIKVYD
jgi:hypothetical protein